MFLTRVHLRQAETNERKTDRKSRKNEKYGLGIRQRFKESVMPRCNSRAMLGLVFALMAAFSCVAFLSISQAIFK